MIVVQNNTDSDNWIPGIGLMWPYEQREITLEHAQQFYRNPMSLIYNGCSLHNIDQQRDHRSGPVLVAVD